MSRVFAASDVPAPESVPPINNPEPQPGDTKPQVPPTEDGSRPKAPMELPGKPSLPEQV